MEALKWLEEIKSAKKREKEFFENGKKILEVYEGRKTPFNILYSNTETLLPALFSDLPRPVIRRRYKDEDPMGKIISEVGQRALEYLLDTDLDEYDNFYDTLTEVTLDGLLPGRGNASVKYEADDDLDWETVCTDKRTWNRMYYGYAKKWSKVPWIAYEEHLIKEEAEKLELDLTDIEFSEGEEENKNENEDLGKRETALFYQIWDKTDRKVKYVSPQSKNYCKVQDDPLELSGFFNCPKPIQFVKKPSDLAPTALYTLYENQAEELNRIQGRINKIVEAIKVRGIYDGSLGDELENLFKEADNALVPASNGAALVDGSIEKAIWFAPVDKLIIVLQQLYQARESCKSVIYEITGVSDIVRGQSRASETLGAQQIKEAWGTMRLKRLQKEVQRYALDMMKIMLDIAITNFSEETWQKMTMLPYPLTKEKKEAEKKLKAEREEYTRKAKEAAFQGQQVEPFQSRWEEVVNQPSWGQILSILQNDYQRSYRLDIETNSTLDVEATEDKQLVGEFMNAMGQFMNGIANVPDIPFAAKKSMLLAISKRYRFGREVEDELQQMQQQQPQIPPQIQQQIQQQQQQIQQQQQQVHKQQQQIQKERESLESDKQRLEEDFKDNLRKIEEEQANFELERKKSDLELEYQRKFDEMSLNVGEAEAESRLKEHIIKHEQRIQSMIDKAQNNFDKIPEQKEPKIEIINQIPPEQSKSISIERENGMITGATVDAG